MADKLKVGVVGVGHLGQHHARNYAQSENAQLVYVCDANGHQGRKIARAWGAKATKKYTDLIGKVDAVSIATPTVDHFEIAKTLLENGVHCLVEKPITTNVKDAAKLSVIAARNNLVLQVGHIEHFNVGVQKFKEYLTTPLFIECHRLGPFDPRVKDIGVVMDLMIHDVDIILRIVNSPIESIEATGVPILTDKEDIASARIKFTSGCIANITCSRVTPKPMRKLRVFQENAYISLDYQKQTMEIHQRFKKRSNLTGELPYFIQTKKVRVKRKEPLKLEIEHFLDCVRVGRVPQTTGEQAMEALDIVIKITEMIREQRVPLYNNEKLVDLTQRFRDSSIAPD
ncbi:MAG: hypothetical protein PWP23_1288 [Candidatus Sumerlaeota bacterium]|nr:hypothetical protein [Candidatus Sumerlaeota bacterium]